MKDNQGLKIIAINCFFSLFSITVYEWSHKDPIYGFDYMLVLKAWLMYTGVVATFFSFGFLFIFVRSKYP